MDEKESEAAAGSYLEVTKAMALLLLDIAERLEDHLSEDEVNALRLSVVTIYEPYLRAYGCVTGATQDEIEEWVRSACSDSDRPKHH